MRSSRPLPPPALPLEDTPQRLTARGTTEPLGWAALRGRDELFTPRTVAAKKFRIVSWALALAGRNGVVARDIGQDGTDHLVLGRTLSLGAATAIPPTLVAALLLAVGRLPVVPAGPPPPPAPGRRATFGTTVASLGVSGPKGLLTSLQQTPPLPRPTCPLTCSGQTASLE